MPRRDERRESNDNLGMEDVERNKLEKQLTELRRQIAAVKASGERRYAEEVKAAIVEYAARRVALGNSAVVVATELGLSKQTLYVWLARKSKKRSAERLSKEVGKRRQGFRAVGVTARSEQPGHAMVTLPSGIRIEGLGVGQVAELLGMIS